MCGLGRAAWLSWQVGPSVLYIGHLFNAGPAWLISVVDGWRLSAAHAPVAVPAVVAGDLEAEQALADAAMAALLEEEET